MFRHIPHSVLTVINRLRQASHQAYIVGGAVRDALLKRPVTDWDVATSADTRTIRRIFRDKRCVVLQHHTVTVVNSGEHIEVTPFRGTEKSLSGDLSRRDFTINAMAVDMERDALIDPHGGRRDIQLKQIRAVHNPVARFQEDPLRLLRAIRLQAELTYGFETETSAALSAMAPLITSAAPERIREEILKILMSRKPSTAFNILRRTGLLTHLMPELLEGYLKRQNSYHRHTVFKHTLETVDRVAPEPVLRVAALLHDIAKPRVRTKTGGVWRFYDHEKESAKMAETILGRMRFSKAFSTKATHLIRHHLIGYTPEWSDAAVRRLIRRVGRNEIPDLLALRRADLATHACRESALKELDVLEKRINTELSAAPPLGLKDLRINGRTVMTVTGMPQGPEVGRILKGLAETVLEKPALNTEKKLVEILMQARFPGSEEKNKS